MAISKSQKFISLLMVLVLCFSFVVPQPEANAELAAGTIALGAVAVAALIGYGVSVAVNGFSFYQANQYWEDQFTSWANSTGRDVVSILADITFANNVLSLGSDSADAFNSFSSNYATANSLDSTPREVYTSNFPYSTVAPAGSSVGYAYSSPPPYYTTAHFDGRSYYFSWDGTTARIDNELGQKVLSASNYSSNAYPVGFFFINSNGNIEVRFLNYYTTDSVRPWHYTNSNYLSVNNRKSDVSVSASVSSSYPSRIQSIADSFSVPSGVISDTGVIDWDSPLLGDITVVGDSPGPDEPGDDDDGTLLGYVHDIAVSLGITGGLYGVVSQVSDAVSNISDYVSDIYDSVSDAITSFGETVADIADSVSGLFDEAFEWFHDAWSDFLEWLQQLIQDIIDAINAGILDITDAISLVISNIQAIGFDIVEAIEGLAPAPVPETVAPVPSSGIDDIDADFDLNLPSIWHYVTSWLACIAPFVSVMQSVWAVLPACIVAPVYAAIVLIIVLGLLHKVIHL